MTESAQFFRKTPFSFAWRNFAVKIEAIHKPMTKEPESIEVEVLEIDGAKPQVPENYFREEYPKRTADRQEWSDWRKWHGRVRRLDGRWWPLWGFLGVIALGLFLTFGLVIAAVFMVFRAILLIVRGIFSLGTAGHPEALRRS